MNTVEQEAALLTGEGLRQVTLAQMKEDLAGLGYRVKEGDRNYFVGRWVSGEREGQSYPGACIEAPVEADTGLRFCNVDARRDANFKELQTYRGEVFAIVKNHCGLPHIAML